MPPLHAQAILLAAGKTIFSGVPGCVVTRMAELGAPCPVDLPPAEHMLASVGDAETLSAILVCLDAQQVGRGCVLSVFWYLSENDRFGARTNLLNPDIADGCRRSRSVGRAQSLCWDQR